MRSLIGDRAFYRRLFTVMLPILTQNLITNFVNLLDNVMVGQVGTEPMSGVAIVNQLLFVFNLCIFGGLAGAGIFTAQFYGKSDNKGVADSFRGKLYIALGVLAVAFFVFIGFGERLILAFIHEGQENLDMAATLGYGKDYLRVMLLQLLPFAVMQIYASTLRETGETLLPMKAGIVAVLVNLTGNYILIFGKLGAPALGVVGAAIATVLSRYVECLIVVIWTHTHKQRCSYIPGVYTSLRIPAELAKKIAVMGLPLLVNELLWAGGMTVLNQCYSIRGLEVVSAINISTAVSNLFFCAFISMGNTVAIMVGQLLGAGKLEEAVDEDRKLIAFAVALCAAVGVVMALLAPAIPQIYNTTDTVKRLAEELLFVIAVFMPVHGFNNACFFTLRSGGKTLITFVFDSVYIWVLCIPLAFCLSRFTAVPILPMYITVQLLDLVKVAMGFVLVKKRMWVKNLVKDE
ncbi:MAG: MATE family efflux transporter [Oscillospiraceae bacterium]|nr:MATE family efflux transporter [Oscillospiraceae bacterium]